MQIVGVATECRNECVADALKVAGLGLRKKTCAWPRLNGRFPFVRIDLSKGVVKNALFVVFGK